MTISQPIYQLLLRKRNINMFLLVTLHKDKKYLQAWGHKFGKRGNIKTRNTKTSTKNYIPNE